MANLTVIEPSFAGNPVSVSSLNTNAVLLAANPARRGYTLFNDSTQALYLLNADKVASSSVYSCKIAAAGYYEAPFAYCGPVNGIWAAANGNARIVEHI